jgi:hypothetical protein
MDALLGYSDKRMIILDCCGVVYPDMLKEARKVELFKAVGPELNRANCRRFYENDLQNCYNTLTRYYSCSIGEMSYDDSVKGGLYTSTLIESLNYIQKTSFRYASNAPVLFSINELHDDIASVVRAQSKGKQNPRIQREKLHTEFPFAVIA